MNDMEKVDEKLRALGFIVSKLYALQGIDCSPKAAAMGILNLGLAKEKGLDTTLKDAASILSRINEVDWDDYEAPAPTPEPNTNPKNDK